MKYTKKKASMLQKKTEKRQNDIFVIKYFHRQLAIRHTKHPKKISFYQTLSLYLP